MCGIVGWVTSKVLDEDIVRRMTRTLTHRGPDADGFYFSADRRIALGHCRLSIIDLVRGGQPMSNESGSIWVIFNGEIYNFKELRTDLEKKGHVFSTNSDTEVILHGYEEYGEAFTGYFNGMFAFALYDEERGRLVLARDRFGKKPLYYAMKGGEFLFGSEIKALLLHPSISRTLDPNALGRYLTYEYVPSPYSIFLDIKKLPPAHLMIYDVRTEQAELSRYWNLEFHPKTQMDRREASEELLARLKESVRLRLVSDVPLGVLLSGGVDSSTVVALVADLEPHRKIKTFNIAFQEKSYDESRYAREIAQRFDTDHHEEIFSVPKMLESLHDVMQFLDEPFGDASLLPTYLLSQSTRRKVTVAMGGDGCDELLAGYPTYPASRYAEWYKRSPRFFQAAVEGLAARLPVSTKDFSFDFKLRQFLKGVPYDEPRRTQAWLGSFTSPELDELLSEEVKRQMRDLDPLKDLESGDMGAGGGPTDWLDRLIYMYVNCYLADDILFKLDRASMACSLEIRAPFLDYTLAEFLSRLPSSFKLRGWNGKYALKKALERVLPGEIIYRRKKGFGIPIAEWLKEDLSELAREELSVEKLRREGLLNPGCVADLLREHQTGVRNHRKQLWTVLIFELWAKRYLA